MNYKNKNLIPIFLILGFLFFSQPVYAETITKTLYAWARDLAGNISLSLNDSVDINLPSEPANTFYISSSTGSDTNNGTSPSTPWKTIAKVNSQTFTPGASILFKSGDIWTGETITVNSSGNSTSPITYSSYGTGEKPVISGFTTITGWTNEGNGIYSKVISAQSAPNMVTVNNVNTAMGRWPNKVTTNGGYLTIDSHVTNTSISDGDLNSSVTNWTGAEVVIRKNHWTIDRSLITNHSGSTINYTSGSTYEARNSYGYFIQNDLKTLDVIGEWAYKSGKFYMYFGAGNPTSYTVKVSTKDKLYNSGIYDYISINNLSFEGSNIISIFLPAGSSNTIIDNNTFNFSGGSAVYAEGAAYITVTNNIVTTTNGRSIYLDQNCNHSNVSYNTITNIGLIEGLGSSLGHSGTAIHVRDNNITEYNVINNVGYIGIEFDGANVMVQHNFINNFCLTVDDGAGIYTYDTQNANRVVDSNIIINGVGNSNGVDDPNYYPANGIYLDDKTENVIVSNNTIANCANYGIFNHNTSNVKILNNTVYNCLSQIYTSNDNALVKVTNVEVKNNIFLSKTANQLSFEALSLGTDLPNFFNSDLNYILRPIADNLTIKTRINGWGAGTIATFRTLSQWQTYSGQDSNSHTSPVTITDPNKILFEYNATTSNKTVSLGTSNYVDITGATKTGSVTLLPYTSIVLIKTN